MLILTKITCDEPQTKDNDILTEVNFEQENNGNKLKYQIDYLSQLKETSQSLLERKENAVWAAFALYITGLVFFFRKLNEIQKLECYKRILTCLILLIVAIFVFAFIQGNRN